jgi:hypothetical protein
MEDSDQDISWCRDILPFEKLDLINTSGRRGQMKNTDHGYGLIQTKYVFHCEDDFQFIKSGFIEPSIKILEHEPMCINVWLTGWEWDWVPPKGNGLQIPPDHKQFNLDGITYWNVNTVTIGEWGLGFTWQPAVHRIEDWKKYGGYETVIRNTAPWCNILDGGQVERNLARHYVNQGYHTRMFSGPHDNEEGYVISTGATRHVKLPGQAEA